MSVLMERTYKNPEKSVLKPALNGAWPVYAIGTALIRNALGLVRAVPNLFIVPLSGPEEHMPHVPKQLRHIWPVGRTNWLHVGPDVDRHRLHAPRTVQNRTAVRPAPWRARILRSTVL